MSRGRDPSAKCPAERKGQDLASFGRISAELLHDLGGMLATLSGRVAVARDEAERGRTAPDELKRIQEDTDDLRKMIVEVLQEVRGDARSPEVAFGLRSSVEDTVDRWVRTAPSVTTTLRAAMGSSIEVAGPRSFFTRTVWNLLRNAGRHAHTRIRLTLTRIPDSDLAEFVVEDDGDGVDESIRSELFTPFTSTESGGMGLGLSFSRWAMGHLGGTLEYTGRSEDLGGARFRITVPLSEPTLRKRWAPRAPARAELENLPLEGLRLALVDDDPALLSVLARVLRRAGGEVVEVAADGDSTAHTVVESLAREALDVILLDLNLGRFTGLDVLETLSVRHRDLHDRTILLTGGLTPEPAPACPVVHKLAEWNDLFAAILLRARQAGK